MEHLNPIMTLLIRFAFLISISSLCQANVCDSVIDAAFQRVENPRYVILVSGSNFWELDRFEGRLVKESIPLNKYWKGAPNNPGLVMAQKREGSPVITFYKNFIVYMFTCKDTIERCQLSNSFSLEDRFPETSVKYTYEAAFYYQKGMPNPQNYMAHVFAVQNLEEFDCRNPRKTSEKRFERQCDRNMVDANSFPNFYKLKTQRELVYAAEAFHNQRTNITDFLVVVDRSIRYTINGTYESLNIDDLFKCESDYFWVVLFIAGLVIIQIVVVSILVAIRWKSKFSFSLSTIVTEVKR